MGVRWAKEARLMAVRASRSLFGGGSPRLRGSEVLGNTLAGRGAVVVFFPTYH